MSQVEGATSTDGESSGPTPEGSRPCQFAGCTGFVPPGSHPARKYCDEHFVGANRKAQRKGEKAPQTVINIQSASTKGSAKDKRIADTAAGAAAFMSVIASGLSISGDDVCAAAVQGGAQQWGQAVGELSKYQPALSKFFAPVGGDSQLGAWLGFLLATGAIALPVMAHHGILPESVGAKMAGVFVSAEGAAPDAAVA